MIVAWENRGGRAWVLTDDDLLFGATTLNQGSFALYVKDVRGRQNLVFTPDVGWQLVHARRGIVTLNTGTDNLDAAITIINLLFDTQ